MSDPYQISDPYQKMQLKGDLKFNRELKATEIVALRTALDNRLFNASKPNKGILPFKFTAAIDGIEWNGEPAYEIDNCLREFFKLFPEGLQITGVLQYENEDEFSYKVQVINNVVKTFELYEGVDKIATLLRCPCCGKVFKKEAFVEVFS